MVQVHKVFLSLGFVAVALYIAYEVYGCFVVPEYDYFKMPPYVLKTMESEAQYQLILLQYLSKNCALICSYFCIYKSIKLHKFKLIGGFICYFIAEIIRNALYAATCEDNNPQMELFTSFGQIIFPVIFFILYAIGYALIGGYLVGHKYTKRSGSIILFLSFVQIFGGPIVPFANYTVSQFKGISDRIPIYTQLVFLFTISYEFIFNKYLEIDRVEGKKRSKKVQ